MRTKNKVMFVVVVVGVVAAVALIPRFMPQINMVFETIGSIRGGSLPAGITEQIAGQIGIDGSILDMLNMGEGTARAENGWEVVVFNLGVGGDILSLIGTLDTNGTHEGFAFTLEKEPNSNELTVTDFTWADHSITRITITESYIFFRFVPQTQELNNPTIKAYLNGEPIEGTIETTLAGIPQVHFHFATPIKQDNINTIRVEFGF
jgi:hypothetical protein